MIQPFLTGRGVYLRAHLPSDLDAGWHQWFNDPAVTQHMNKGAFPNTREDQAAFLEEVRKLHASRKHLQLAIVERATDQLIGVVSLAKIDWINRSAEIAMVIGEREKRSRGHGLEAMALMAHHAFSKLNLHRVWAGQHVGLARWKEALVRHLGYKEEGHLRDAIFTGGRFHGVVIISVLAPDWLALVDSRGGMEKLLESFAEVPR